MMLSILAIAGGLFACGIVYLLVRYFSLWLQAYASGTRVPLISLVLMSMRAIDPKEVVKCKVMAAQAGLPPILTSSIESQILAGGNVPRIVLALITAQRAEIDLDWDTAAAIDLAGRDILEAVRVSVYPKVIDCPAVTQGKTSYLIGVARDGIQLKVRVRVTVRTNLMQLIGGATEETVIARVGEGIVSVIGSCDSYREVLCDPLLITRKVASNGLDAQTAYSIVSIDIADIDLGENIGANLQRIQATSDIRIARALAENRRAMAVAREREMIARTREKEAAVVFAEAEIPSAIADAYRKGHLRDSSVEAVGGTIGLRQSRPLRLRSVR